MKVIKYKLLQNEPLEDEEPILVECSISCRESDLPDAERAAQAEAYNGEYEIVDDGEPEPTHDPTVEELTAEIAELRQIINSMKLLFES